jgi:S1-C subfamily serine protease
MKRFVACVAAVAALFLLVSAVPTHVDHRPVADSTVYIDMGTKSAIDADTGEAVIEGAHGSGVSIGNGLVLTAAHVADNKKFGEDKLKIVDSKGRDHKVKVLWANHKIDVALLKMDDPTDVASSHLSCRYLDRGERLTFAGNPFDLLNITTYGRVANPAIIKEGYWDAVNVVDADIGPGMSGGPVFDRGGNVVGVNVGTMKGFPMSFIVPGRTICGMLGR